MDVNQSNKIFHQYLVFKVLKALFKGDVIKQSLFITSVFILLIALVSLIENTAILPKENVGLFEHPTIWTFFIIQFVLPYMLMRSINRFFSFLKKNEIVEGKQNLSIYYTLFIQQVSRKTNISRFIYAILISAGVICFAWNSFQNQHPYKFLGFDFWDSFNHPFGYLTTRLYKFYLWVLLFPAFMHLHICVLITLHKLLKDAERERFFTLKPYNPDGYAGVGDIIKIAIDPIIPVLLVTTLSVLSTFIVHHGIAFTPIIGSFIQSLMLLFIYFIPAIKLRKIIKAEKDRQLKEIADSQNLLYFALLKDNTSNKMGTITTLSAMYSQVKSISVWPYWSSTVKMLGIINIPAFISIAKNIWPLISK